MEWDDEAQQAAARQARKAASRDPDAALALTEQLIYQPMPGSVNTYNPTAIRAQLLHNEHLKPAEIDAMDYVEFFGLVRELSFIYEREQDEYDRAKQPRSEIPESQVIAQSFPTIKREM